MSPTPGCHFCGRTGVEWHHLTGRLSASGAYLDPLLVVPLCKRHHDREHEVLRRLGLEFFEAGADLPGHRLARVLDFLGRSVDHGRPLVMEGEVLSAFHALLLEALATRQSERRDGAA